MWMAAKRSEGKGAIPGIDEIKRQRETYGMEAEDMQGDQSRSLVRCYFADLVITAMRRAMLAFTE